jgi:hypothetical protein
VGIKKVFSKDFNTQKLQDNVSEALKKIEIATITNGIFVKDVALVAATDISVSHKLNRLPIGFFIVKSNGDVRIWESSTNNLLRDKLILFRASGTATATIYIF